MLKMKVAVSSVALVAWAIGMGNPAFSKTSLSSIEASHSEAEKCNEVPSGTQVETLNCYIAAAARSHSEVQRLYRRDMQTALALDKEIAAFAKAHHMPASPSPAKWLQSSQLAWIRYSRSQCAFEGGTSVGGSGTDILDAECHQRLNSKRIAELNAAYDLLNR